MADDSLETSYKQALTVCTILAAEESFRDCFSFLRITRWRSRSCELGVSKRFNYRLMLGTYHGLRRIGSDFQLAQHLDQPGHKSRE